MQSVQRWRGRRDVAGGFKRWLCLIILLMSVPLLNALMPGRMQLAAAEKFISHTNWLESDTAEVDTLYGQQQRFAALYYRWECGYSQQSREPIAALLDEYELPIYGINVDEHGLNDWIWESLPTNNITLPLLVLMEENHSFQMIPGPLEAEQMTWLEEFMAGTGDSQSRTQRPDDFAMEPEEQEAGAEEIEDWVMGPEESTVSRPQAANDDDKSGSDGFRLLDSSQLNLFSLPGDDESYSYPFYAGYAAERIDVIVDGQVVAFAEESRPQIVAGRTMLPMRSLAETFGFTLDWQAATRTAVLLRNKDRIEISIDAEQATLNGKPLKLDMPAQIINDRTYVPLRFFADALGYDILWNDPQAEGSYGSKKVDILTHDNVQRVVKESYQADSAPAYSSYDYSSNSGPQQSLFLFEKDGQYLTLWALRQDGKVTLVRESYGSSFTYRGSKRLRTEYQYFGGAYLASDGYLYIVYGNDNLEEKSSQEVFAISKYDTDLKNLGTVKITGRECYTTIPFRAGTVSFAENGSELVLHTSRQRYTSSNDGLRHQSNITLSINREKMQLLDVSEAFPDNHVSHSFAQYVRFDGKKKVYLDHGDAYPRSIYLQIDDGKNIDGRELYTFPGEIGANYTGCNVGGFELSERNYLLAANSSLNSDSAWRGVRNIMLMAMPKSASSQSKAPKPIWLTDFTEEDDVATQPPQLIPWKDDRFIVAWDMTTQGRSLGLSYLIVDGNGQPQSEIRRLGGVYLDTKIRPIIRDDSLIWFVHDSSLQGKRVFYMLEIES